MQLQSSVFISTIGVEIKMKILSHTYSVITEMTLHANSYMSYVYVNSPSKPRNIIPHLSQYLTNLMHKICFTISFISCLYTF